MKKKIIHLIHKINLIELKNKYKHLSSTKTKAEIKGGGKKPWQQKGTGNARAGSIRSPLWKGGGIIFGPKIRLKKKKKNNNKERKFIILLLFFLKKKQSIKISEKSFLTIKKNYIWKTKEILFYFKKIGLNIKYTIIFIFFNYLNFKKFFKGINNIKTIIFYELFKLNINILIKIKKIFITFESLNIINLLYKNFYE